MSIAFPVTAFLVCVWFFIASIVLYRLALRRSTAQRYRRMNGLLCSSLPMSVSIVFAIYGVKVSAQYLKLREIVRVVTNEVSGLSYLEESTVAYPSDTYSGGPYFIYVHLSKVAQIAIDDANAANPNLHRGPSHPFTNLHGLVLERKQLPGYVHAGYSLRQLAIDYPSPLSAATSIVIIEPLVLASGTSEGTYRFKRMYESSWERIMSERRAFRVTYPVHSWGMHVSVFERKTGTLVGRTTLLPPYHDDWWTTDEPFLRLYQWLDGDSECTEASTTRHRAQPNALRESGLSAPDSEYPSARHLRQHTKEDNGG